ncbi:MAG: 4Fe-4S dicluster domain-containing protein [Deltaproteobacteria bacterium]|nr:4Fe-4S dicluster domain-containing protein [Deltaproteobacteria bacterium]MBZ0219534.1 4Fe-4S dicluster domain-containing protein [Deltaproteobacteria bacterium]
MKISLSNADVQSKGVARVERLSGEDLKKCYQCGNCSAGCPVSYKMEIPPTRVMRMLQLGKLDEVKAANSMWLCVGCLQCYSRCPKGCSVAAVLEAMRQDALREGGDRVEVKDLPMPLLKKAPQQAIVCGFRKFVS